MKIIGIAIYGVIELAAILGSFLGLKNLFHAISTGDGIYIIGMTLYSGLCIIVALVLGKYFLSIRKRRHV